MGSWQAMSQLEFDIVQEEYTPFNCRKLLGILLSAEMKYRQPPGYKLFRQIIFNLWPDLLKESINPKLFKTADYYLGKILKMTGSYNFARRVKKIGNT